MSHKDMSTRKYPDDFINKIICGDCLDVMKEMPKNSIDATITDPPYGLEFMGKEWDKFVSTPPPFRKHKKSYYDEQGERREKSNLKENRFNFIDESYKYIEETIEHRHYFQEWCTQWLTEAYRVLKPGGSMLVMGGTRTSHRLACAIEDSGFIIKDTLMWLYGSGFPKAQDLGKMIDKRMGKESKVVGIDERFKNQKVAIGGNGKYYGVKENKRVFTEPITDLAKHWNGFKVGGIKPAYEPIIWAVKPPEGSYVDNVLKWGVGAVNVDECRVGVESDDNNKRKATGKMGGSDSCFGVGNKYRPETLSKGRFPANVILDEEAGRLLDEQSGILKSGDGNRGIRGSGSMFPIKPMTREFKGDSGGASRFFYCAKASKSERGEKNKHPTVKPIALFMWLIQLVTREGQLVLDPFIGSGTTMLASQGCNRKCVGIEKDKDYCKIAEERLAQGVL